MKKILEQYAIASQEEVFTQQQLNLTRIIYCPFFNKGQARRIILIGVLPNNPSEQILKIFDIHHIKNIAGVILIDVLSGKQYKDDYVKTSVEYFADINDLDRDKIQRWRESVIDADAPKVDSNKIDKPSSRNEDDHYDLIVGRRGRAQVIDLIAKELNMSEEQKEKLEKVYRSISYTQLRTKFPEIVPYILRVKEEQDRAKSIEYDLPEVRNLLQKAEA